MRLLSMLAALCLATMFGLFTWVAMPNHYERAAH